MLHLENKSFFILLSPFAVFGLIWALSPYVFKGLENRIDSEPDAAQELINTKGETYKMIQRYKSGYTSLLQKIVVREQNRAQIAQQMYHPIISITPFATSTVPNLMPPPPLLRFSDGNITTAPKTWSVQMVLPLQNVAIINNRIQRVGQRIDGVQLLQVEASKVLIRTERGDQWIKLFH